MQEKKKNISSSGHIRVLLSMTCQRRSNSVTISSPLLVDGSHLHGTTRIVLFLSTNAQPPDLHNYSLYPLFQFISNRLSSGVTQCDVISKNRIPWGYAFYATGQHINRHGKRVRQRETPSVTVFTLTGILSLNHIEFIYRFSRLETYKPAVFTY